MTLSPELREELEAFGLELGRGLRATILAVVQTEVQRQLAERLGPQGYGEPPAVEAPA